MNQFSVGLEEAVEEYQLKNNLPQLGIVGPLTKEILNSSKAISPSQFIELLIKTGVISADKSNAARTIFGI